MRCALPTCSLLMNFRDAHSRIIVNQFVTKKNLKDRFKTKLLKRLSWY